MSNLFNYLKKYENKSVLIYHSWGQKQYGILDEVEYSDHTGVCNFFLTSSHLFTSDFNTYRIHDVFDNNIMNPEILQTFWTTHPVIRNIYLIKNESFDNFRIIQGLLNEKLNRDVIKNIEDFIPIELLEIY